MAVGVATFGVAFSAELATLGAGLGILGATLGGFASFFGGSRTASLAFTVGMGTGSVTAIGGIDKDANASAIGGLGNNRGATFQQRCRAHMVREARIEVVPCPRHELMRDAEA